VSDSKENIDFSRGDKDHLIHPDVAICLNNQALIYDKLGDHQKAEPLYVRALEIREKALDPDHPSF
jgi:tetratricopeptide (TPR) repeat protein